MDLRSSKFPLLILILFCCDLFAQSVNLAERDKDYKDPKQFERFYKRRWVIAEWQINQLKKGALVVKLRTNQLVIDGLKKAGNYSLAEQKRLETLGMNTNLVRAYMRSYDFSKIYFTYSNNVDTLRKGLRSGIFLDSNLQVDPSIQMTEQFYLLAESDQVYNSSIGFLPEDSAADAIEKGNPIKHATIVVKNKYGHQLKRPFPFYSEKVKGRFGTYVYIAFSIEGATLFLPYNLLAKGGQKGGSGKFGGSDLKKVEYNGQQLTLTIPKEYTMDALLQTISDFNDELKQYYQHSREPDETTRYFAEVRPFLY
jgi:hypothetical protein